MNKIFFNDSFDFGTDLPLATIADDPAVMRKCASAVVDEWGPIDPVKGHTLIHLIAMGAHEKTGNNRNGDTWTGKVLEEKHPTFKKHGALYRNHKAEAGKEEGFVHKTAYNKEMGRVELIVAADNDKCADWLGDIENGKSASFSMGFKCLPSHVRVRTDQGYLPVSELIEGDMVLGHSGKFKKVTRTFASSVGNRKIVGIKGKTTPYLLETTDDHQVYTIREEKIRTGTGHKLASPLFTPEWVPAGELKVGDYLIRPIITPSGKNKMPDDIAYLLGQYLGDGHTQNPEDDDADKNSVVITTNVADRDIYEKMIKICLDNEFGLSLYYYNHDRTKARKKQAVGFRIRDPRFRTMCLEYCGFKKDKYPRNSIFSWSESAIKNFLAGYVDADGSFYHTKKCIRTSSILDPLTETIQQLFFSIGVFPTWHRDFFPEENLNPKAFKNSTSYANILFINKGMSWMLNGVSVKVDTEPQDSNRCQENLFFETEEGKFLACRIKELSVKDPVESSVYCLSVEDDESFVAEGFVVHNCTAPGDKCACCGNFALDRSQYCEHVKKGALSPYGMGRVLPDGRKCFVYNDAGFFNDISKVPVGADQIAMGLRKVASLVSFDEAMGGAELAEQYFTRYGNADGVKLAIAMKCADIQKRIEMLGTGIKNSRKRSLSKVAADKLRQAPTGEMFLELAKLGAVLPLVDFYRLVLGNEYESLEPLVQKAAAFESAAFIKLAADPFRMESVCSNQTYDPSSSSHIRMDSSTRNEIHCEYSLSLAEDRAIKRAAFSERLLISGPDPVETPQTQYLLDNHCSYKLSALRAIDPSGDYGTLISALI